MDAQAQGVLRKLNLLTVVYLVVRPFLPTLLVFLYRFFVHYMSLYIFVIIYYTIYRSVSFFFFRFCVFFRSLAGHDRAN